MNPPPVPSSIRGRGKSRHSKGDGDTAETSISWQADVQRTNKLVDYLVNNMADCCVLFSSEGKKPSDPNIEGPPLGKDKNAIHAVMLRPYSSSIGSEGFGLSSQLCSSPPQCNIPSTSTATCSGTGVPQFNYPPPPHPPPLQFAPHQFDFAPPHQGGQPGSVTGSHPQWSYISPQSAHPGGVPAPQFNFPLPQNAQPGNASGSLQHWNFGLPPQGAYTGGVTGSLPTPQFNFAPPPQSVQATSTSGSPQRWNYDLSPQGGQSQSRNTYSPGPPTLSDFPGMDDDNDNPLADDMEDLRIDESVGRHDDDNVFNLNSPPKSKWGGKKCQQPPSYPTPSPPHICQMGRTHQADGRNLH
ncbi:hypothetical protein DFJ58DRAFT_869462 [Suillus subalutaceus]|uniref:uncharacterized protein n=1 Tax=Suillus subalutaceus TaxID=48586 RepID=UPI001B867FAD|nr:uncharacterized protein DFJ58DRAFT_869462 [Suillus subalutaceus]KAG1833670.1 hypothetical protein DFJ58DRAFT_869462 [Suillus subalutaceus]